MLYIKHIVLRQYNHNFKYTTNNLCIFILILKFMIQPISRVVVPYPTKLEFKLPLLSHSLFDPTPGELYRVIISLYMCIDYFTHIYRFMVQNYSSDTHLRERAEVNGKTFSGIDSSNSCWVNFNWDTMGICSGFRTQLVISLSPTIISAHFSIYNIYCQGPSDTWDGFHHPKLS